MKFEPQRSERTEEIISSLSVKTFLTATAVIEAGAGLALLCVPSVTAVLLLGAPLETPAALSVARIGGAALLTLAVAMWFARGDTQSRAVKGLVAAMVLYNLGAVVILGAAGVQWRAVGVALWPAVVLHAAMTAWCIISLLRWKHEQDNRSSGGLLDRA